uniref:PDZ domain containing 9 n=1 Tax=Otus sunia TaxID=257818 RepID=A0A8C8BFM1_9STRI
LPSLIHTAMRNEYLSNKSIAFSLGKTLKTNIRMGEQGLGLIILQHGPYLQITSLVEKSSAANEGKLKPGDVLIKLRQLLHNVPIGTTLQIRVYRDFVEVPLHWQSAVEFIPERKLPNFTPYYSNTADKDDTGSSSDDDGDLETFQYESSQSYSCEFTQKLPSISKIWQISDRGQTLRVGTDNFGDAVPHDDVNALSNPKFEASGVLRPASHWAMENNVTGSSASCSSVSDTSYVEEFAFVSE